MPISNKTPIAAMIGELDVEQPQRQRRADAGGEQGREDGDRMDQALVENPEHDIDRDHRGAEQKRHARLRLLIGRGGAGEGAADGRRHADALDRVVDLGLGLAERAALGKVERDRRRRERSLVIDAERRMARGKMSEGRERDHRLERGRYRRASRSGPSDRSPPRRWSRGCAPNRPRSIAAVLAVPVEDA